MPKRRQLQNENICPASTVFLIDCHNIIFTYLDNQRVGIYTVLLRPYLNA